MISIQSLSLSLQPTGAEVNVTVRYRVVFDQIDRLFFSNGVDYTERVTLLGRDSQNLQVLGTRDFESSGWTMGDGQESKSRQQTFTMSRHELDEDIGGFNQVGIYIPNNDEIRCKVEIIPLNPPTITSGTFSLTTLFDRVLVGDDVQI